MKYLKYFVALILIFCFSLPVFAHPGSLDENGGHWNHKTGEYHYHDGTNQGNGTQYNSSNDYDYNYYYENGEQYFTVVQPSVKNDSSNFNREQFMKDWERVNGTPPPQPTPTPSPTPKPTPKTNTYSTAEQQSSAINNFIAGSLLSLLIYAVTYSCFVCIIIVFEPHPTPKISSISYEPTYIDHFVCFSSAVGIVATFDTDLLGVILVCFFFYTIKKAKNNRNNIKRKIAEEEEKRRIEYNKEKDKYTLLYGGKNILEIIDAPPTAFIDSNGLPHQSVKNDDIFVIYLAPKQPRVYHRHKGCGKNLHKDNYINLRHYNRTITPCKKCCPTVPDTSWYYEYLKIKRIKKEYNIE